MSVVIKCIYRNPSKYAVFTILTTTAYAIIGLFLNIWHIRRNINHSFYELTKSFTVYEYEEYAYIIDTNRTLGHIASSVQGVSVLAMFLCIFTLFVSHYIFTFTQGYEVGVLRVLGLSKRKALLQIATENAVITSVALLLSFCVTPALNKRFAFALLGIDSNIEQILQSAFK